MRHLPLAVQMADVERQLEIGCVEPLRSSAKRCHRVDEHAGLGLKADGDARFSA